MAKSPSSEPRVEALTGARALAGLYILLFHFGQPLFARAPEWAQTLRAEGYIATSFFLMLSGFVLTIAYGRRFLDGRVDRRGFLVARVARLYPCYLLALALLLPFALSRRLGDLSTVFGEVSSRYKVVTGVAHAAMLHVWVPRMVTSWNLPGWCVSVEMWFYVAFPLLAGWLLAKRTRALFFAMAGAWLAALAMSIAYAMLRPDGFVAGDDSSGFWLTLFKFTPYTRWPEFVFGVALGGLWLRVPAPRRGRRWSTLFAGGGALATLAILLAGHHVPYTILHNGALLPLYGVMVWGLMLGEGPLHRLLSIRPLTAMGDAGYVLYLIQLPMMEWLLLISGRRPLDARFTAIALAVIVAVSIAVHRLFERRAQAWLKARLEQWFPRPATLAPSSA